MRDIQINNFTFNVRSLTRGELKELRAAGFNLAALEVANADEAVDLAFELMFSDEQISNIDALDYQDSLKIWNSILSETYGDQGEEKNLSESGPGTQTPTA